MMKKILILNGSPRKKGNTEALVNAFSEGAEAKGHQVTHISVVKNKVNGCMGCDYCLKNEGKCIQKDDMKEIYDALYDADMVVFATPVYYFGISAQLKAIIDRFYATIAKPLSVTSSALLVALGGKTNPDATGTIENYRTIIKYLKWEDKGVIVADGVMDRGAIKGHIALQKAKELGSSI